MVPTKMLEFSNTCLHLLVRKKIYEFVKNGCFRICWTTTNVNEFDVSGKVNSWSGLHFIAFYKIKYKISICQKPKLFVKQYVDTHGLL